jgi:hypothetical protein
MARNSKPRPVSTRSDGRKPFFVYLPPDLIRNLKAVLDNDQPAYELVEIAVLKHLKPRRAGGLEPMGA